MDKILAQNNEKIYVLEYRSFDDRSFSTLGTYIGIIEELQEEIIKHHRKICRKYIKENRKYKWDRTLNSKGFLNSFTPTDYIFVMNGKEFLPTKIYNVQYGVIAPCSLEGYRLCGRESYRIYEIDVDPKIFVALTKDQSGDAGNKGGQDDE